MCFMEGWKEYDPLLLALNKAVTSCVSNRTPGVLCRFVTAVLRADMLSHVLAVGCRVTALHARVAAFCVLPEDASVAGHSWGVK